MKPGARNSAPRRLAAGPMVAVAFFVTTCASSLASADEPEAHQAQGPYMAVAGGAWTIDLIGVSDGGPRPHGHAGGEAELGWLWGTDWATSASFRWGGSWFDFDAFAGLPLGQVREKTWLVRLIVDRRFSGQGGRSVWFGTGYLYGEAHTDINTITLVEDPPPNFLVGGLARVGAGFPVGGAFELYGELEQALFRGRGGDPDFQERYTWLGRSLAGHVGLRLSGHGTEHD